ncbi:MAG TPA: protein kinase [Dictyobacter sp.]|nr:protein kinase [Dictyobacter sp.]
MVVVKGQHLIGKVLGSCVLEKLLGHGGSSAVFLAQQRNPQRKVAVKVFLPRSGMDDHMQRDFYRRFLREAEAVSQLDHAHILPIYAYGEQDGLPYIVMPYMEGGTLADYMSKRGPLSLKEAQWYLAQIASALDYAHEQGCVHCDVKPANILLDSDGHVLLSDFGIARLARTDVDPQQTKVTHHEAVLGTPDYISPEQALGKHLDGRSDVYSLGITLFFVLTKRLPFRAESTIALALQHVHEVPPSLTLLRADVTSELDYTVLRTLAKDPKDRFQTAGEFNVAFANALTAASEHKLARVWSKSDPSLSIVEQHSLPQVAAVRVKPSWLRGRSQKGLFSLASICVLIIASLSVSLFWMLQANSNHTGPRVNQPSVSASTTVIANTPQTDLLANMVAWPQSSTSYFNRKKQEYYVLNQSSDNLAALSSYMGYQFQDFQLTITMNELKSSPIGEDYYGVVFRASSDFFHYYLFEISPTNNKQYEFLRYDNSTQNNSDNSWQVISSGQAPSLHTKQGQSNTVTIVAQGNTFSFRINGSYLGFTISDTATPVLSKGSVGLYVDDPGSEVAFSHLSIESAKGCKSAADANC